MMILFVVLLVLSAAAVRADIIEITATKVSCVVTANPTILLKCPNEPPDVATRTWNVVDPANFLVECANECARRDRAGRPCVGFIYRSSEFELPDRRETCVFFTCRSAASTSQRGVVSVALSDQCFETIAPSTAPFFRPSQAPSASPSASPTPRPSAAPTVRPSTVPSSSPQTSAPSAAPTRTVTSRPTLQPTTRRPSLAPTRQPTTVRPTKTPTDAPSRSPTRLTLRPTSRAPSASPVASSLPPDQTSQPTFEPTSPPSIEAGNDEQTLEPSPPPTWLRRTNSPFDGFRSPSGIPPSVPLDRNLFVQLALDQDLCQIARPKSNTFTVSFNNFGGTVNDCLKECQYDAFCMGVLFSANLRTCTKAVMLETTDDDKQIDDFSANWVAFRLKTRFVPYYAQFCGLWMSQATCNRDSEGQCRWGVGVRGYNQNRETDYGYCGRVSCKKRN